MAAARNGMEWFRPVWRRVALVAFCVAWCAFEWLYSHDQFWSYLTLGVVAYAVWTFFINFDKQVGPPPDATPKP